MLKRSKASWANNGCVEDVEKSGGDIGGR